MSKDTDLAAANAMIRYGGSFVQGLAHLFRRADPANRQRLIAAFPDVFSKYYEIAQQRAATAEKQKQP